MIGFLSFSAAFYYGGSFNKSQYGTNKGNLTLGTNKINLCDLGANDLSKIENIIRQKMIGITNYSIIDFFSNKANKITSRKKINSKLVKLTGVPIGYVSNTEFKCPQANGNLNKWYILILETEQKEITMVDLHLKYVDLEFAQRQEEINSNRFASSEKIAKAINNVEKYKSYTREQMKKTMTDGNFIFHRSCENDTLKPIESDIYFASPEPPNSINVLLGEYYNPNLRPNVALYFNNNTQKFTKAKPGLGSGVGECIFSRDLYGNQFHKWLKDNHPNSYYFNKSLKT